MKILGHSKYQPDRAIKITERYTKLGHEHIPKTSTTAKAIWSLMTNKPEEEEGDQEDLA